MKTILIKGAILGMIAVLGGAFGAHALKEVLTPMDLNTSYTYDGAGRLKTESNLQSGATTYTYNVMDNVKSIENQAGKLHTFKYDFMGHKTEEKDFNGNITRYEYDANGNMKKTIDFPDYHNLQRGL